MPHLTESQSEQRQFDGTTWSQYKDSCRSTTFFPLSSVNGHKLILYEIQVKTKYTLTSDFKLHLCVIQDFFSLLVVDGAGVGASVLVCGVFQDETEVSSF